MAWIYRNQTEWIISLSSDGTTWITIADKNLWATQVYNSWDTLSQANSGNFYQRWNNYGFPFTWATTTSSTQVNASTYWPWNYYSSGTFITSSNYYWDSSQNWNLWWWETWTNAAMQWPCDNDFHIPSPTDYSSMYSIIITWLWLADNSSTMETYLMMPMSWRLDYGTWQPYEQWERGYYRMSTIYNSNKKYAASFYFLSTKIGNDNTATQVWHPIRPFKNEAVIPDRTWTKLYWDDLPLPQIKRFINNWNYYYFGDAPIHISWLALDKSSIALTTVWQTEQLTATITPEWAVETKVLWSSSDTSIATVDNTWLVTCITPWECTITATCGGYSATCSVI